MWVWTEAGDQEGAVRVDDPAGALAGGDPADRDEAALAHQHVTFDHSKASFMVTMVAPRTLIEAP